MDCRLPDATQNAKTLGRKVNDTELVSITTWMKVEDQEERDQQSRPIAPK